MTDKQPKLGDLFRWDTDDPEDVKFIIDMTPETYGYYRFKFFDFPMKKIFECHLRKDICEIHYLLISRVNP